MERLDSVVRRQERAKALDEAIRSIWQTFSFPMNELNRLRKKYKDAGFWWEAWDRLKMEDDPSIKRLEDFLAEAKILGPRKREEIKLEYGPNPNCSQCGGSGWLGVWVSERQHEVVPCDAPGCLKESLENYRKRRGF